VLRVLAHACAGATVAVLGRQGGGWVAYYCALVCLEALLRSQVQVRKGCREARTCLQTLRELAPRSLQQRPSPRVRRCNLSMKAHLSLQGNRGEGEQRQGAGARARVPV
jgi:hypothetical protein